MSRRVAVVAKLAHNQTVGGSNPPAATKFKQGVPSVDTSVDWRVRLLPALFYEVTMTREELIEDILDHVRTESGDGTCT